MQVRRAIDADIPGIDNCLSQVLEVHAKGRPDLFRSGTRKYTDDELREIIADDERPVFVAVADDAAPGEILGYGFCVVEDHTHSNNLQPIRTLYIDDICVDEGARGPQVLRGDGHGRAEDLHGAGAVATTRAGGGARC